MTTAISPSRRASTYGTLVQFQNLAPGGFALQQRIAMIAHGSTTAVFSLTKAQIFSAFEAGTVYGFGSQIHEMALQLFPASGDGVGDIPVTVYPLADGTTVSDGIITPTGTTTAAGTVFIRIGGVDSAAFAVPIGMTVAEFTAAAAAAINSELRMPVVAVDGTTVVTLDCKWQGVSGNDITIAVFGAVAGQTYAITDMANGAGDPAIDSALLDQFGEVHETLVLNGLGGTTAALDALSDFNEGRWLPELSRPIEGAFYATVETDVAVAIVVPDARKLDRTNVQLVASGSVFMPWAISARMCARIAKVANSRSAASDYIGQIVSGITPGADGDQWTSAQRDTAVKAGASTSVVRDGALQIDDTVTMFHPAGDPNPAFSYVNNNVKLANLLNDLRIVFDTSVWKAAPLIPDNQATTDPAAKQPKMAKAEVAKLIDSWGLRALISDPATAKESIVVAIDGGNPRRINIALTVQISGNAGIVSVDLNFGFFFGGAAA